MESPTQVGNVLNEYFYSVFSADSCYDDFKSDNQEKIVIDESGISNLIDRLKVGKPPGPDCCIILLYDSDSEELCSSLTKMSI